LTGATNFVHYGATIFQAADILDPWVTQIILDAVNVACTFLHRRVSRSHGTGSPTSSTPAAIGDLSTVLGEAAERVLRLPLVGSKAFRITIGDRSVTSLVARGQMVGPWQVPGSDVGVTRNSYGFDDYFTSKAVVTFQCTPLALGSAAASARMAAGEALTNLVAASMQKLERVKLGADWMCAAGHADEGARLYEAVQAVGLDLCQSWVSQSRWARPRRWHGRRRPATRARSRHRSRSSSPPLRLPMRSRTPGRPSSAQMWPVRRSSANGKQRRGGSCLAQVFRQLGDEGCGGRGRAQRLL